MSREGLYKALSADGNPSFATVLKVSRALGLRLHFESIASPSDAFRRTHHPRHDRYSHGR